MNPVRHIRRIAAVLAGLACGLLALTAAGPAALAANLTPQMGTIPPPGTQPSTGTPGQNVNPLPSGMLLRNVLAHLRALGPSSRPLPGPAQVHTVVIHSVTGGMPGWQIALIALGAALAAATIAVLADRARTAHRHETAETIHPDQAVPSR